MKIVFRAALGVMTIAAFALLQAQSQAPRDQQPPPNIFSGSSPQLQSAPVPQGGSVIPYRGGQDIGARIPQGAFAVTVLSGAYRPFVMPTPEGMNPTERWTRESDAVGVFRVIGKTGEFTPERDWIFSLVEANVVEVLKPSAEGQLSEGQTTATFRAPGGVATLGGTVVTAVSSSYEQVSVGGTYLVFLIVDPDHRLRTWPGGQFEIRNTTLRSMEQSGDSLGSDMGQVTARIRAARDLPRVWPRGGVQ